MRLYWGGRTLEELYYHDRAAELAGRLKNAVFSPVLSRAPENWQGARGYVWQQALRDLPDIWLDFIETRVLPSLC